MRRSAVSIENFLITVEYRNYCCDYELNLDLSENKLSKVTYVFNRTEKLGNTLMAPSHHVFKWFANAYANDLPIKSIALFIAAVASMTLGVVGFGIKKLGECYNPKSGTRQRALKLQREIFAEKNAPDQEDLVKLINKYNEIVRLLNK